MDTNDLLTVQQVADLLGIKPSTVQTAIHEGRLPCVRLYGRRLVKREDVLAYQQRVHTEGVIPRGRPRKSERPPS